MDVTNAPRITRYVPPTISRRISDRIPRDIDNNRGNIRPERTKNIARQEDVPTSTNPLARLFDAGSKPVPPSGRVTQPAEHEPTVGRFLDVTA